MRKSVILTLLFAVLSVFSCKRENEKPFIVVQPEGLLIEAYNDQKLVFYVDVFSDFVLQRFIITKKLAGEPETVLLDTTLTVKNFSLEWAFRTPKDLDEDLFIYFNAISSNGEQSKIGRRITFTGKKMVETSGQKLYSFNNNGQSAYDFANLQSLSLSSDSTLRDLEELQGNPLDEHLTNHLFSPTGCTFVKFNDFDYGNAATSTAKAAYNSGVQLTEIGNLKLNDIYIVKINRLAPLEVFAVIKFTGVFDNEGVANDFYEFSVKK